MIKRFFLDLFPVEIKGNKSFRALFLRTLISLIGLCFLFFSYVLMAQLMGAKGFGNYAVIFTYLNILVAICLFGFDKSVIAIYPPLAEQQQWKRIIGLLSFSRTTILISSLAFAAAFLFVLISYSGKFGITFSEALFWALPLFPFLAFIQYDSAVMDAMQKPSFSGRWFNSIITVAASVSCLVYYELNNKTLKTDAVIFIYLCCTLFVFIFNSGRLKKIQYHLPLRDVTKEYQRKAWLSVSMPIFVATLISLLMKSTGILFISYFFGNARAGIYAAAVITSSIVPALIAVPQALFLPRIRELYESRSYDQLKKLMSRWLKTAYILSLPVSIVVIVFGKFILQIFGTAFVASYVPLLILTVGQLINFRLGMATAIVIAGGYKGMFLAINILAVIFDLALHFFLVPKLGMHGAAIASVLSLTILNLLFYLRVKKKWSQFPGTNFLTDSN